MPPPISSLSTRGKQVLDDVDLARHLRPADDRDERPLRVPERIAQVVELLLHEEARRRLRHELRDALGRGVGAVRAAERVVDVDVRQRRELLGEGGIVLLLGGVEAQVLEQEDAAGLRAPPRPSRRPGPRSRRRTRPARRGARTSASATGRRLMSGTRFPSGRPRCDIRMTFALFSRRYLMVGSDSLSRLSLSTLPSLSGTLKSTRTMTRLPATARSSTNSFLPVLMVEAGLAGEGAGCRDGTLEGRSLDRSRSDSRAAVVTTVSLHVGRPDSGTHLNK